MSFTCPRCGRISHNANDERERYCGWRHVFVDDPPARCAACGADQPYGRIRCDQCGKPLVFPVRT